MTDVQAATKTESVLQLKVRLLGISSMIWRRLLVPESMSLHELHGVLQVAMGWEGIRLFQFNIRGIMHAGPYLHGQAAVDVPLSDLRFRRNGKFRYVYDMNCWWDHELRVEDRVPAVPGKRYPNCIGGSGACPPEGCGGPDGYFAGQSEAMSLDAMEDVRFLADFIERAMIEKSPSVFEDEDIFERVEWAVDRFRFRARFLADRFHRAPVNRRFRACEHQRLMHQQMTFA